MDNKARTAYRRGSAIPHWASSSVLENPANLELIEQGVLTSTNLAIKLGRTKMSKSAPLHKNVVEAWGNAKAKYPGVGLFTNPQTKKEKALKSTYDNLVKEFGKHPSLPRPKVKPGSSTARVGMPAAKFELGGLLPIISMIGQITKALQG
jgi:hypothetical protein